MVRGFKTGKMVFTSNYDIFFIYISYLNLGITIEKKSGITTLFILGGRDDARSFRNCKLLKVGWDKSIEIVIAALFSTVKPSLTWSPLFRSGTAP